MTEHIPAFSPGTEPILIADCNNADAAVLKHCLKEIKLLNPIIIVSDAHQVIRYLTAARYSGIGKTPPFPALLLLDITTLRKNRFDVLSFLKSEIHYRHLPLIVIANKELNDVGIAYRYGVKSFLTKPASPTEVLDALEGTVGLQLSRQRVGISLQHLWPASQDETDLQIKNLRESIQKIEAVVDQMRRVVGILETRRFQAEDNDIQCPAALGGEN